MTSIRIKLLHIWETSCQKYRKATTVYLNIFLVYEGAYIYCMGNQPQGLFSYAKEVIKTIWSSDHLTQCFAWQNYVAMFMTCQTCETQHTLCNNITVNIGIAQ